MRCRFAALFTLVLLSASAWAQPGLFDLGEDDLSFGPKVDPELKVELVPADDKKPEDLKPGDVVTLRVEAITALSSYTYSQTSELAKTEILLEAEGLTAIDDGFTPDRKPKLEEEEILKKSLQKFYGGVVWTRDYKLSEDATPADVKVTGRVNWQACGKTCQIMDREVNVALIAGQESDAAPTETGSAVDAEATTDPDGNPGADQDVVTYPASETVEGRSVTLTAKLSSLDAAVGETVSATLTYEIKEPWHIQALTRPPGTDWKVTTFEAIATPGLEPASEPEADREPKEYSAAGQKQLIYEGKVTFTREFKVTQAGYGAAFKTSYQLCKDSTCLPPKTTTISLGLIPQSVVESITPAAGKLPGGVAAPTSDYFDKDLGFIEFAGVESHSLWKYLFYAFLGGMILNVMPCVLPVIAIKVLGFVQQAGDDRKQVFLLNASYSLGVIAVFGVLAALAVTLKMSWGGLFQLSEFNVAMTALVFAMGLSLLGVFELPVPGLAGAGMGTQKEGLSGAFLTGIFATLLATPCSGPFLGPTLAWSVDQLPVVTVGIWLTMGLGMAFPYLIFGLNPELLKWLPKPGNWMVRFKELCGFVMMGTAIYLVSIIPDRSLQTFTLILLLGVGIACWMIGNFSLPSVPTGRRWQFRLGAFAVAILVGMGGWFLTHAEHTIPFRDFNEAVLAESLEDGKPVLLDFTADWCLTCRVVERTALETEGTRQLLDKHEVVALKADWTQENDMIAKWVERFDSESIPLLAIFPPGKPGETYSGKPIVLRDVYSEDDVHQAIEMAISGKAASTSAP